MFCYWFAALVSLRLVNGSHYHALLGLIQKIQWIEVLGTENHSNTMFRKCQKLKILFWLLHLFLAQNQIVSILLQSSCQELDDCTNISLNVYHHSLYYSLFSFLIFFLQRLICVHQSFPVNKNKTTVQTYLWIVWGPCYVGRARRNATMAPLLSWEG